MKKLLPILVLFISLTSFAQTKFIEVVVKDTITLQPATLQCNIFIKAEAQNIFSGYKEKVEDALEEEELSQNQLQELKSKLEAKKYTVKPLQDSGESFLGLRLGNSEKKGYTVIVNGIEEVNKLKEIAKELGYAETSVSVLKYADEEKAEELLIKKIITKAKTRASVLGGYSGLKVGKIVEIKEIDGSENPMSSMKDMYSEILKMKETENNNGDYTGSLSKGFRVKFASE